MTWLILLVASPCVWRLVEVKSRERAEEVVFDMMNEGSVQSAIMWERR